MTIMYWYKLGSNFFCRTIANFPIPNKFYGSTLGERLLISSSCEKSNVLTLLKQLPKYFKISRNNR